MRHYCLCIISITPYGFEGQIIPAFLEVKMKKDTYLRIVKMQA